MGWKVRDENRCKLREGELCPDYGDNPEKFTIRLYHSGSFHELGLLIYMGGSITHIDHCDPDEMSLLELSEMAREIGLEGVEKMYYNRDGPFNCTALWPLETDMDAMNLGGFADSNRLVGVGIDGNNRVYPFAYAVVEKEKKKTWRWFIKLLLEDLGSQNYAKWTVMSDKQKGLIDVVESLMTGCEHRFCVTHLYQNFKQLHRGLVLKNCLWKAARASRMVDFDRAMRELKQLDKGAFNWLAAKPPAHWSRSHFRTTSLCDRLENNMSECFNAMILKVRSKPIVSMFETIRVNLMKRLHVRRDKVRAYHGVLCPTIDKMMEDLKKRAMEYRAHWNGENQFEVESTQGFRFKVNLSEWSCSCIKWELSGLPCSHAISAIYYLGKKPEDWVPKCFKREHFLKCYSNLLRALNSSDMWPKTTWSPLLPPVAQKMPGRPKTHKRKPQPDEQTKARASTKGRKGKKSNKDELPVKISKKGSIMTCSLCHKPNHNARSCPLKPRAPPTESQDHGGRDIPAANQAGTSNQRKKKNSNMKNTTTTSEEVPPTESQDHGGRDIPAANQADSSNQGKKKNSKRKNTTTTSEEVPNVPRKRQKKKSDLNVGLGHETDVQEQDLSSYVPDHWWDITSPEQVSQITKDSTKAPETPSRVTRSKATSVQETPPRATRSKAPAVQETPPRVTRSKAPAVQETPPRVTRRKAPPTQETPPRVTRSKATTNQETPPRVTRRKAAAKEPKNTQESTSVPPKKKMTVRKRAPPRDPLDGPPIIIDKPNPKHFVKPATPKGGSTLTNEVRFSKSSKENPNKMFIREDALSNCRQM